MATYMLYYVGISGVLSNAEVIAAGDNAPVTVISLIFGRWGATILTVFVVISCLGTLNGLVMGSARGMFAIASRDLGPYASYFARLNPKTNSTERSAYLGFVLSVLWLGVWYGNFHGWWNGFVDISELPIAFLYVVYISIYVWVMRTFTTLPPFARYGAPLLATAGSLYIIWGATQKDLFLPFLALTLLIMGVGIRFSTRGVDTTARSNV